MDELLFVWHDRWRHVREYKVYNWRCCRRANINSHRTIIKGVVHGSVEDEERERERERERREKRTGKQIKKETNKKVVAGTTFLTYVSEIRNARRIGYATGPPPSALFRVLYTLRTRCSSRATRRDAPLRFVPLWISIVLEIANR